VRHFDGAQKPTIYEDSGMDNETRGPTADGSGMDDETRGPATEGSGMDDAAAGAAAEGTGAADATAGGTPDAAPADSRRLRLTTTAEQREFTRLARRLLGGGLAEPELRRELGYDTEEELRRAVETGRATTSRLERLRTLAWERMHLESAGTTSVAATSSPRGTHGDAASGASSNTGLRTSGGAGRRASAGRAVAASAARGSRTAKSPRREFLEPKQHARLVEHVDHLRAVDRQFYNWSLLAKVMGLSSGQAARRAYEVNSSVATLANIERFAKLHAGFGSRATNALKAGLPIAELQDFLTGGGTRGVEALREGAEEAAVAAPEARRRRPRRVQADSGQGSAAAETVAALLAASVLPAARPAVDVARLAEVAAAIDAELGRLWDSLRFFDGVARTTSLPRAVRAAAAETRRLLEEVLNGYGGEQVAAADPHGSGNGAETVVAEDGGTAGGEEEPGSGG
jgi:hypothetical protein